ncbi:hypothetical protein LEMLEM_LOCUS25170 [Lemmus lemmus]
MWESRLELRLGRDLPLRLELTVGCTDCPETSEELCPHSPLQHQGYTCLPPFLELT